MEYFVYYHDGYSEDGDEGLKSFEHLKEAQTFIEERLNYKRRDKDSIEQDCYVLIRGTRLEIKPVETVTKIEIINRS